MHVQSRRPKVLPNEFKHNGWTVVRWLGVFYGVPKHLDAELLVYRPRFRSHPAVLKAMTRSALLELIDRQEDIPTSVEEGSCEGYRLIRRGAVVHAVPRGAESVDLDVEEERRNAGVLSGPSVEDVRERLRMLRDSVPVEFAGWLPIYELMGNCGQHPQFAHTFSPPEGFYFTRTILANEHEPAQQVKRSWTSRLAGLILKGANWVRVGSRTALLGLGKLFWPFVAVFLHGADVPLRQRLRLLGAFVRLFMTLRRGGGRLTYVLRFLHSRSFHSQILMAAPRRLVFLTSAPYTYNQNPWVIEIEDPTTLFFPFIHNGQTSIMNISESPYFPIVKALLESEQCRVILTHMRSTAELVPNLFKSEIIARKVRYYPLGVKLPRRWQQHNEEKPEQINLLFINSWSQHPGNFQVRGGLDVLEAFAILHKRYPHLRLTMRTSMIPLDDHYPRIIESGWVRVINRFMSVEEMEALHAESHIYLLPSARIHIVSLLQAMASGLAVVASDGWGINEYLTHEENGLIVKGRYGKTSWVDEQAGMLRETFEPMTSPDPEVVQGIVEAVSRLVEDDDLRRRLGRSARQEVETTYTLENWNQGLKEVFNSAVNR
jgi:glycosyltransferase involved in cell wall biosynthesis